MGNPKRKKKSKGSIRYEIIFTSELFNFMQIPKILKTLKKFVKTMKINKLLIQSDLRVNIEIVGKNSSKH